LIDFDNFCTVANRNEYSTKCVRTVFLQLNYVSTLPGKTKNNTKTAALLLKRLVEPIVSKFCRKSFNVRFFPYLLEHSFSSLPIKNLLHSRWFYQKFIFKINMVNFNMYRLKLNCRDMQHVTVMKSSS